MHIQYLNLTPRFFLGANVCRTLTNTPVNHSDESWPLWIVGNRNSLRPSDQINPVIHRDALAEIDSLREERSLGPSAPPSEEGAAARRGSRTNCSCPICLADCFLPIETNCGHMFCGKLIVKLVYRLLSINRDVWGIYFWWAWK